MDYIIHFYLYKRLNREVLIINNKKNEFLINNEINAKEIRLIDADGTMLGIVPVSEALELAFQKDLDLVEISPNAAPPVYKIADYNKTMYEKAKKEKEAKKSQKVVTLKEIRLSAKKGGKKDEKSISSASNSRHGGLCGKCGFCRRGPHDTGRGGL